MNDSFETIPSFMKDLIVNKDPEYPFNIPDVAKIKPEEGFCLKTKDTHGNKIFINFCHSTALPTPKDIDEDELSEILTNPDEEKVNYRVPISLGEAKEIIDKSGVPCFAHDVVVNSDFFAKLEKSCLFKNFVIQVAFEGLEDKTKTEFNKQDWIVLKNKKYMGTMSDVTVRTKPKTKLITELTSGPNNDTKQNNANQSKFSKCPPPEYEIIREPMEGDPTRLLGVFRLPLVINGSEIQLDLGEDRILLCVPNKYFLDIFLPYNINVDSSHVTFNVDKMELTLVMPVN